MSYLVSRLGSAMVALMVTAGLVVSSTPVEASAAGLKSRTVLRCTTRHNVRHCAGACSGQRRPPGGGPASHFNTWWMNSPEHRANILNTHYGHIGIGVVTTGSRVYMVEDFTN